MLKHFFMCQIHTASNIWLLHDVNFDTFPSNVKKTKLLWLWVSLFFLAASSNTPFKVTSHVCGTSLRRPSAALSTDGERWQFGDFDSHSNWKEEYLLVISHHSGRKESLERHQWGGVLQNTTLAHLTAARNQSPASSQYPEFNAAFQRKLSIL